MRLIVLFILLLLPIGTCHAEDKVAPVFDQLDDIIIRVESGVSLNSYAEALAGLKIEYKKAAAHPDSVDNPLLSDRMKTVLQYMDDYAKAWKLIEIDKTTLIARVPSYVSQDACAVQTRAYGTVYRVPCVKEEILTVLKQAVDSAKSAHVNGW